MAYLGVLAADLSDRVPRVEPAGVEVHVYCAQDWPKIEPIWKDIDQASPYSSFYLSPDWTSAWIEIFGERLQPQILVFKSSELSVGACLLVGADERRGPFRVRRLYLNSGGGNPSDRTLMEFNSLLCREGWENSVAAALWQHLRTLSWDEFVVEGVVPGRALDALRSCAGAALKYELRQVPSLYVDLRDLRCHGPKYEHWLSANTRAQLRRSLKLYARSGPIRTEIAPDLVTAQQFFAEMRALHQQRWTKKGETGAFARGLRLDFHRALIRRAFANNGIQMLRVSAGGQTIGILYNFVRDGKVYFFQSGFRYEPEKHLKPGLVTHACAIQHCVAAGYCDYDFLAGDARYKRSLARKSRDLAWVTFARPSIKLALIGLLRSMKRRVMRKR
jgi:CelD/BcsL family acetyltransferase involved in cellulose biosynthesis